MGRLAEVIGVVPSGWRDGAEERIAAIAAAEWPGKRRAWRLWLEADWARRSGSFALARQALDAANEIAEGIEWTPVWGLESRGLDAKLLQDGGEPGRAYGPLKWAMDGWLLLGGADERPEGEALEFLRNALRGAEVMVTALVGSEYVEAIAREFGGTPFHAAAGLWFADRPASEAAEVFNRAVSLEGDVASFSKARQLANDVLAATRSWQLPEWEPIALEVGLRLTLGGAASAEHAFASAIGQADDGLALAAQLHAGEWRTRQEASLHSNRAGALFGLGRSAEAATEFDQAQAGFAAIAATTEALRTRVSAARARASAGEPVGSDAVRQLIGDLEATAEGRSDGGLMRDLELTRRWLLSLLALERTHDLEEVISIIEVLRDDRPVLRSGTTQTDPVVVQLCRPFTVLGARLRKLADTALVVLEPGLGGEREPEPVLLVISAGAWHLVPVGAAALALKELARRAADERARLLTAEVPLRAEPSEALSEAAASAWEALPSDVRSVVRAARTVLYMPSAAGGLDAIPFELLLHDGGWLGTTHVVARCPSFQELEVLLAPSARCPAEDARALVAHAAPDERLGVLSEVDAEVDLALRAAALLGLDAQRRELTDPAGALEAFSGRALVHYVGHGFAGDVGEVLPLSFDSNVSASELPDDGAPTAPFVFFSACLLGRVRHLPGGRQQGWALRLLKRGAPAIVGALAAVPDSACVAVAEAFYVAAWKAPVGEAMREARMRLHEDGVHPLVWAAYVLHGDPNAGLSAEARGSTADLVRGWPALATRFLATSLPEHRDALRDALAAAPDAPEVVRDWATGAPVAQEVLARAVDERLGRDPEGAAACRILLAHARLELDPRAGEEFDVAYLAAAALEDGYAVLHVLATHLGAWKERHPGEDSALVGTARFWLTALAGDRVALTPLEARLPHINNLGVVLGELGRSEEELVVYDDVVARYGDAPEPALRERVAGALFSKGFRLGELGRSEEELVVYDDVVARYGDAPEPALREQVAGALVNKGAALGALGRSEEAVVVYDDVVARYGDAPEPALREQVARALLNKGVTLGELGRSEEELVVYDDVVARYGDAPEPALREQVARALLNKGVTLGELGRSEEELVVYDDVVARYGDAPEPALRERVAGALFSKGVTLGELGRSEEELVVYDDVVARYGDAPEPALRERVAGALFSKGFRLGALGRSEEAVVVYDDVVARYGDAPEPALREQVAGALVNKGAALGALGRSEEELVVYDDVVARYGDAPEPALRERVARALVNKGFTLGELGRSEEELVVYDDVVARYGDAPEPALREQVAGALVNKGAALGALGRSEEAVVVYDDVVARYGDAPEPEPALREAAARALSAREQSTDGQG